MRGLFARRSALCWLAGIAAMLAVSEVRAQSGVISGPPQVQLGPGRSTPDSRPGPGPQQGPKLGPQGVTWIAVVGGSDGTGKRVGVGYSGPQRSRVDAEDAAIRACNRNEPSVACRDLKAVSTGCLYIVPGTRSGGAARWGHGSTRAEAFEECRRGGYTCLNDKLIGGCVTGSN
jgi:hypothetical protein